MPSFVSRQRQRGAVIVTTALFLLFLLGFMGFALDFGRLFIVKTELQTAMDSCALAAANELDGQSTALMRATSAGMTAGNLNNVNLQSATWNGQSKIVSADITFKDASYGLTNVAANAKYAQCQHTQAGTKMWLLQMLGAFSGDSAIFPAARSVAAAAVATRTSSQTSCMLPIGICGRPGGYQRGEWILGTLNSDEAVSGQFSWLDFNGNSGGAKEVKALLQGSGQCDLPGADSVVRESGNIGNGAASAYNTRFGIYTNNSPSLPRDGVPDFSGYAYYRDTVPSSLILNKYPQFAARQASFASYQGDDTGNGNGSGNGNGNNTNCNNCDNPGLNNIVPPGNIFNGSLASVGSSQRRVVTAPIVSCPIPSSSSTPVKIDSVACIFLLHPIKAGAANPTKMWLEYLGAANDPASPCSSFGLAGGTGGPLVPALVR